MKSSVNNENSLDCTMYMTNYSRMLQGFSMNLSRFCIPLHWSTQLVVECTHHGFMKKPILSCEITSYYGQFWNKKCKKSMHILLHNKSTQSNKIFQTVGKSAETFICEICPFKTTQKRYLREHKRTRHGPDKVGKKIENYTCHICSEIFPYSKFAERSYIQHYRSVHNTECPEYEDMEKFLCEQCPAIYFNKQSLKAHILKSHVNGSKISKQTTCKKCKISFFSELGLTTHRRRRSGLWSHASFQWRPPPSRSVATGRSPPLAASPPSPSAWTRRLSRALIWRRRKMRTKKLYLSLLQRH